MLLKDYQENYGSGWVKIYRSLIHNRFWTSQKFTRGQAWVDLLLLAKYKGGIFYVRDVLIEYLRGDITEGVVNLSKRWKWSRGKTQNFLDFLEKNEQQIRQQKLGVITLITITNYDQYQQNGQQNGQQDDNRMTIDGQYNDTHKKDKKVKKDKNTDTPAFSEFLSYCKTLSIYHSSLDFQIEAKYNAWVENKWKDGNNKAIKNWKIKIQNTMPYFKRAYTAPEKGTSRVVDDYNKTREMLGKLDTPINEIWKPEVK